MKTMGRWLSEAIDHADYVLTAGAPVGARGAAAGDARRPGDPGGRRALAEGVSVARRASAAPRYADAVDFFGLDWTDKYQAIAAALRNLPLGRFISTANSAGCSRRASPRWR
jgi:hypothetical protein